MLAFYLLGLGSWPLLGFSGGSRLDGAWKETGFRQYDPGATGEGLFICFLDFLHTPREQAGADILGVRTKKKQTESGALAWLVKSLCASMRTRVKILSHSDKT